MSKMDQIKADMIAALKAGERQRKDNIAYLYGILKNVQIDKRADLTEEEIQELQEIAGSQYENPTYATETSQPSGPSGGGPGQSGASAGICSPDDGRSTDSGRDPGSA